MNQKGKKWVKLIASVMIVVGVLFLLQRLLVPKYVSGIIEGAFIAEFYEEEKKDYDVVFVGDCEVYENFSPITLWEEYGVNSYIRGSAEQYIWQSYYILEDTLRYHTPEVVIFNVQAMQFNESQSEAYNRMTIEGMEWSMSKVNAINASMKEDEQFLDYVFPILRYHSRWNELTANDFKYMFETEKVSHNGYYMRVDVKPVTVIPPERVLADYRFGDNAWKYLNMMADLCEEKGIDLVLIKAPSLYPHWYDQWDAQIEEFAEEKDLKFINFLDLIDEIGIDYNTDTYDAGLHMNLAGAEKLSKYLGNVLTEEYGVPDRRDDEAWQAIWQEKIEFYEADKQSQYEKYGMTAED